MVAGASKVFANEIDARWLMSYAAGLGDPAPAYFDTEANDVIGHPMFSVCLEWPPILDCINIPGAESITPAEHRRDVHAAHDLHISRCQRKLPTSTLNAREFGIQSIPIAPSHWPPGYPISSCMERQPWRSRFQPLSGNS